MQERPRIIGLVKAPYASLEKYLELLEKSQYLVIKLDVVACEILKDELKMSDVDSGTASKMKDMIWKIHGKSYLVEKAVRDWMPWVESYAEVEPRRFNYVITDIETPEEARYLRMKFNNDFKLIAVYPPRDIRFNRFQSQTQKTKEDFLRLEDELIERGIGGATILADFLFVIDENEKEISKALRMCGIR